MKGQSKMNNSEKLATQGSQDEDKQKNITTQCFLNTNIHKQTQQTSIRHEPPTRHWR